MGKFSDIHIEKDFWDDFIVEAFEHIDAIESNTMSLEQNPENMDLIHTMFRAFHTIKGLAGFVEHSIIQEIAHKTETLMDLCRKGDLKVTTEIVNAILKTSDYIKQMCNDMDVYKDEALVAQIEHHLEVLEELSNADWAPEVTTIEAAPSAPVEEPAAQDEPVAVVEEEDSFTFEEVAQPENVESVSEDFGQETASEPCEQDLFENVEQDKVEESEWTEVKEEFQPAEENSIVESQVFVEEQPAEIAFEPVESVEEVEQAETVEPIEVAETVETVQVEEVVLENVSEPMEAPVAQNTSDEHVEAKPVEKAVNVEEAEKTVVLTDFQKQLMNKLSNKENSSNAESSKDSPVNKQAASEEYMKVANNKIDHLVDMISELIINQSLIEQYVFSKYTDDRQLVTNMSGFLRITRELQNLSMSLRMVSLKSTFQKVARIARDTIQELHKEVEVVMSGENTEIDRVVAEKMLDPLVHMIKNSISHGIEETPEDRVAKGKNHKGRVELNAYSKRGKIFIEVKDDGRGIDTEIVYQKALEKGLIETNRTYSDAEIKEFIMLPGFSTAKVVDNISGRGVGMDVVKTQILKIGGKVEINSELNKGSAFVLEVPVNHAIMNGTIIEMNDQQFVVPTVNVKEFLQPKPDQWISTKSKRTMIKVRDNIIPLVPTTIFSQDNSAVEDESKEIPLVTVLELDQELRALPVTNVVNRQEVVVKPVSEELSHLKYISGMSILGTGKVSLILDIDYLFRKEIKE